MPDKIRWGIISTARIGPRALIPAINNAHNGELVAVASRDEARARAFADQYRIPVAYGSYTDLINDPNIDAIYNPLPNDQHGEWSIRAAEAGKHVLCEKPLSADAAEARRMVEVFNQHNVWLEEAFMYRFHPRMIRVKEMVKAGELGKIQYISSTFNFNIGDENDIRLFGSMAGGGLMDVGCYCVGVMRFLTDEEPDTVSCFADVNSRGADERAVGILKFPSGIFAHFDTGMRSQYTNRYEVIGTQGRIIVEDAFLPPKSHPAIIQHWFDGGYEDIETELVDQYQLMVEDFDDAILNKRPPRFPADDGVRAMELLDRLRASAAANGDPR